MLKHVAKHNQQRAIIVYRELPDPDQHMALIAYSGVLPKVIHDDLMKCVEGVVAQSTPDLANVLFRTLGVDGNNLLTTLHSNGWLKKVPTNQVIVTPTNNSTIRLDELNKLLGQMAKGDEAKAKMAEMDSQRGATGIQKQRTVDKEVGVPPNSRAGEVQLPDSGFLSDADLAAQRQQQADNMKRQAQELLAEATRLEQEANQLAPTQNVSTKKTKTTKKQAA